MKKLIYHSSFFVIFLYLITASSCTVLEKIPFLNKESVVAQDYVDEEISIDSIDSTLTIDEIIINDSIDPVVLDSLTLALQERIDSENSGEAIVNESNDMMNMIEDIQNIPYFEDKFKKKKTAVSSLRLKQP